MCPTWNIKCTVILLKALLAWTPFFLPIMLAPYQIYPLQSSKSIFRSISSFKIKDDKPMPVFSGTTRNPIKCFLILVAFHICITTVDSKHCFWRCLHRFSGAKAGNRFVHVALFGFRLSKEAKSNYHCLWRIGLKLDKSDISVLS